MVEYMKLTPWLQTPHCQLQLPWRIWRPRGPFVPPASRLWKLQPCHCHKSRDQRKCRQRRLRWSFLFLLTLQAICSMPNDLWRESYLWDLWKDFVNSPYFWCEMTTYFHIPTLMWLPVHAVSKKFRWIFLRGAIFSSGISTAIAKKRGE